MTDIIIDDINRSCYAISVVKVNYNPLHLTNEIYEVIDNRFKRRQMMKKNPDLYKDFDLIKKHRDELIENETLNLLIESYFKKEEIINITSTDRLFLNSFFRKLLRAKLELDHKDKTVLAGQVIFKYNDHQTDHQLAASLRLFKLICNYLGLASTFEPGSFSMEKLYAPKFWANISEKFLPIFGEYKIQIIEAGDPLDENNPMFPGIKKIKQAQALFLLKVTFDMWSGSTFILDENQTTIKLVPSIFITRMLPKLR